MNEDFLGSVITTLGLPRNLCFDIFTVLSPCYCDDCVVQTLLLELLCEAGWITDNGVLYLGVRTQNQAPF